MSELDAVMAKWSVLFKKKFGRATAKFVENVSSKKIIWLLVVLGVGLLMHEARNLFYKAAPWMIKHSTGITVTLNLIMLDFYESIIIIKAIVAAIKESLFLLSAGHIPHHVATLKEIAEPPVFNATIFRQTLKTALVACGEIDTGYKTTDTFVRAQTNDYVCPLLRAATPMGKFGKMVHTLGKPFSFDPTPQGNNCSPDDFDETIAEMCLVINSGKVILQIILPIMIALILLRSYFTVVIEFVYLAVETTIIVVNAAVRRVSRIVL